VVSLYRNFVVNEHQQRLSRVAVLDSVVLCLADTVVGVVVGVAAAGLGLRLGGQRAEESR
jgi:hypothetical protein